MKDWNTRLSRGDIQNIEFDNNHAEGHSDQIIHTLLIYKNYYGFILNSVRIRGECCSRCCSGLQVGTRSSHETLRFIGLIAYSLHFTIADLIT